MHTHTRTNTLHLFTAMLTNNCPTPPPTNIPAHPILSRNNEIGRIQGTTGNYNLSFEILPTDVVSGMANILHFTTGRECCEFGTRTPAFWLFDRTRIRCTIGDSRNHGWSIETPHDILRLNVPTRITLVADGRDVTLTVGRSVFKETQPTRRFAGTVIVYAGSPWTPAAIAEIRDLSYRILPAGVNAGK